MHYACPECMWDGPEPDRDLVQEGICPECANSELNEFEDETEYLQTLTD